MNELIIVRHGETMGESSVRLYGSTDIELSDFGREQMRRVGAALRGIEFAAVYTSPMRRSRESANIAMDGRGPDPRIVKNFREIDFGNWEGWTMDEAAERDPVNHAEWKKKLLDYRFPGGDSKIGFFTRIRETAREVFAETHQPALAVLHKGVMRGVLGELTGRSVEEMTDAHIELASIHRLRRTDGERWELFSPNETSHLGDHRIPESK